MMRNLCKKTWAFLLVAAMLLSAVMVSALEEVPVYNDPKGMVEYADEILGGVGGNGWSAEQNMNEVLKDFAWRPQYYDANPEWDGFYTFKWVKGNTWSGGPIDEYVFGHNWLNSTGQFSYQGGVWYMVTNNRDGVRVMSLTFIAPEDGVYKVYGSGDVRVMYPQYFPQSGTLRMGFAIHKMAADGDMNTFDPAGSTRIWPANKNYEYLTNDTLSYAFPTLEEVELKAGERLRFVIDARETEGIDDWLVSAAVCPLVEKVEKTEAPAPVTNKGGQVRGEAKDGKVALRFGFDLPCTGIGYEDAAHAGGNYKRALGADSKVQIGGVEYPVVDFGAILSLDATSPLTQEAVDNSAVIKIPATNLYEVAEDTVTYTAVITNVPDTDAGKDTAIYARSYVAYEDNGETKYAYGEIIHRSVNECNRDNYTK